MVDSTLLGLIYGQWAASLQKCAHGSPCFLATPKSMRSSRFSGSFLDLLTTSSHAKNIDSVLGTPDENSWPGVTSFPDFKSSFPRWNRDTTKPLITGLDETGLDLLERMMVYDPAGRISAKQACQHPYFELGDTALAARNPRVNGYH